MLKFITGFVIGAGTAFATQFPWIVVGVLVLGGVVAQMGFARALHETLGGTDPMAIGARSLSELKDLRPIPIRVTALDFLAKSLFWAALVSALAGLGMIRIT